MKEIISSKENKIYKRLIKLHQKKQRDKESAYLVEGENLVLDSAKKGTVELIVFSKKYYETKGLDRFKKILEARVNYLILDEKLFDSVSETETPQGVLGISRKKVYTIEDFFCNINKIVVLDKVQDPGNVGTIIRTAKATKHSIIILKGTADPYSPKVVRSTMSAISDIPILFFENSKKLVELLKKKNITLVGGDANGNVSYKDIRNHENVAIVLGNEANGISEELIASLDKKVSIPMEEGIESLNVAVAAGLMMYESYSK